VSVTPLEVKRERCVKTEKEISITYPYPTKIFRYELLNRLSNQILSCRINLIINLGRMPNILPNFR
jgi:hypothetical protein